MFDEVKTALGKLFFYRDPGNAKILVKYNVSGVKSALGQKKFCRDPEIRGKQGLCDIFQDSEQKCEIL